VEPCRTVNERFDYIGIMTMQVCGLTMCTRSQQIHVAWREL